MDDDDKAALARQGLKAMELLQPGKVAEKVKGSVADAASEAALRGIAAVGRLTGKERSPARARAVAAVDLGAALDSWDADEREDFDARVREAVARKAADPDEHGAPNEPGEAARMHLAELRRSFPEGSRELALLVFNCVDLLEDLSDDAEGAPPWTAELERKEKLLLRLAELMAPGAGAALQSFVEHVVAISRRHRGG